MAWRSYARGPIDWWSGWQPYEPPAEGSEPPPREELRASLDPSSGEEYERSLVFEMYQAARPLFEELGWEGDGEWHYAGIPGDGSTAGPDLVLAVKQQNNGTVFLLSPVPLTYLD
jgi:hypothetical protein